LLPRAWERFLRADCARTDDGAGLELELAIIRTIAEPHGDRADAANRHVGLWGQQEAVVEVRHRLGDRPHVACDAATEPFVERDVLADRVTSRRSSGQPASTSRSPAFCDSGLTPADMWRAIATPDRAAAFLAGAGAPAMPIAA
jgi:hypothetical protein